MGRQTLPGGKEISPPKLEGTDVRSVPIGVGGSRVFEGYVLDDLLNNHKLFGRDRNEVISLIGEPTNTAYFHEYDLVYWLGMERSHFAVDSEWLIIKLDESGEVIEARTATD